MATEQMPTCYRHPDRPTGLSCSECGRPICVDCMTVAPVGIRCPEHAGGRRQVKTMGGRVVVRAPGTPMAGTTALVTKTLIAVNVIVYLITVVQGAGPNNPGGSLFDKFVLVGWLPSFVWPYGTVAGGELWRLATCMFLHANIIHIAFNMLALWWFGGPVEEYLGRLRFLLLYVVAGLAGSAGALFQNQGLSVGASGAIFGILGAMLILEYQATGRLGGNAMTLIVINLAISFAYGGIISWGAHVGGLIGGILATLSFARFGRGHAAYGRLGLVGILGVVLIGAGSVAIAYWKAKSYVPAGF